MAAKTFTEGQAVEVFDRTASRTWRAATIERVEPYRGRPGYYIGWKAPVAGGEWQSWDSRGGWVPGQDVREEGERTIRIASAPCGAGDAFLHPACANGLSGVEFHDMTIGQLVEQQILVCDGCGERIVPKGVDKSKPDTHYVPPFTTGRGHYQRAVCGAVTDMRRYHSVEPTCAKCAAWLEADAAEAQRLAERWNNETREGKGE